MKVKTIVTVLTIGMLFGLGFGIHFSANAAMQCYDPSRYSDCQYLSNWGCTGYSECQAGGCCYECYGGGLAGSCITGQSDCPGYAQ